MLLFVVTVLTFTYRFYTYAKQDQIKASLQAEYDHQNFLSIIESFAFGKRFNDGKEILMITRLFCRIQGGTEQQCQGDRISALSLMFNYIGVHIEGIMAFAFFGLQKKNLDLWRDLFKRRILGQASDTNSTSNKR